MSHSQYSVELTGKIREGVESGMAVVAFARLFKLQPQQAQNMLARAPLTIKKDVNRSTAEKLIQAIEDVGLMCRMLGDDSDQSAVHPTAPTVVSPIIEAEQYQGWSYSARDNEESGQRLTIEIPDGATLLASSRHPVLTPSNVHKQSGEDMGLHTQCGDDAIEVDEYIAEVGPGELEIDLAEPVQHVFLEHSTLFVQGLAFVALAADVHLDVNAKNDNRTCCYFRCRGRGDLWFSGDNVEAVEVDGEFESRLDRVLAFSESLILDIEKQTSIKSMFFSDKMPKCRLLGQGKVWVKRVPA